MEELNELERRIDTTHDLRSVVSVMKTVAASRIHQYEEAVVSADQYGRTIEMGLQIAMQQRSHDLARRRAPGRRLGAVIIGSDQGLCGDFNQRIVEFSLDRMQELGFETASRSIVTVGRRPAAYLETSGYEPEDRFPFAARADSYTEIIVSVLEKIEQWNFVRGIETIALFYNRPTEAATFDSRMEYLLPPDVDWLNELAERDWTGPSLPTFGIGWDELLSSLVNHHIFFIIYRAFVASLASENMARLRAMEAAEKNIDERLDDLETRYNRVRQASITAELLDISTGYQAISEG